MLLHYRKFGIDILSSAILRPKNGVLITDDDSTDDMNLAYAVLSGVIYRLEPGNLKNADDITDFVFDKKFQFYR
ncbi:hypothetical protein ATG66_0661 [Vibrio sp. ES.051]|nr:hypothetical protein ATG66_0661 [Vibrio sp. ES.051]